MRDGDGGGKGRKSKCENNVQARAHAITWQEETFANQSINHSPASSKGQAGRRAVKSCTFGLYLHAHSCKDHGVGMSSIRPHWEIAKGLPKMSRRRKDPPARESGCRSVGMQWFCSLLEQGREIWGRWRRWEPSLGILMGQGHVLGIF